MKIPFFTRYPYTDLEYINLDWLMETTGKFDARLTEVETKVADHEERITTAEGEIDDLQTDLGALTERVTAAEEDIDTIQTDLDGEGGIKDRLTAAENDIDGLDDDIDGIKDRLERAEDNIVDLQEGLADLSGIPDRVQRCENDIIALDSRVDDLEEHSVVANPGGSGVTLTTLEVDGTTYSVPQGGGGGGSSVTPNPAGTATADLTKVDIDGIIYAIPTGVDTSDLIAVEYDSTDSYAAGDYCIYQGDLYRCTASTTGSWDSSKWSQTVVMDEVSDAVNIAENIEQMYADLGTAYEDDQDDVELSTRASGMDTIPGVNHTLTPGSWIVTLNCTFDTHELGSKQRLLNIYLVDGSDNVIAQFGKYMWGSEAISAVLYENSCSLSAVVDVPYGTTKTIYGKVAVRVNTGSGTYAITTIRLGSVRIKPYAS